MMGERHEEGRERLQCNAICRKFFYEHYSNAISMREHIVCKCTNLSNNYYSKITEGGVWKFDSYNAHYTVNLDCHLSP
uniref:Uncharacterized protein n=1 Tax=Parascaris univalens TaxID=6257 RepID=A0A914ZVP6_PARUN